MPRRANRRSARPEPVSVRAGSPCPCGAGGTYAACCGRFHSGRETAPTAEALMRSRYSAFVVRDEPYLLRTWAPATRPASVDFDPGTRWAGLEIAGTTDGTLFHTTGTVTFVARYTQGGEPGSLHERSRFEKVDGAWVYVDGTFL
ncbi:YchJ family protein [Streptomyces sp. SP18CS02]|uniref:YchJ family protein n=1 Tax=Streptomyces sp. SP18CS02 TaxID=3002531 RepID=UPI002E79BD87|nr:YchJ family protein [Streptomyces sp. SP18CS02]MEE1754015.1 YchJ family protein [Streptomyces sp. SP18CS02]